MSATDASPHSLWPHLRRVLLMGLVGGLLLSGCLPRSCQQRGTEALFPADSTSRQMAKQVPVDTLQALSATTGTQAHPLAYPRTVQFRPDSGLVVSDVERNSLFHFGPDATFQHEDTDPAYAVPYLIGARGDTLLVFNAEADRVDTVVDTSRLGDQSQPVQRPAAETLVYLRATETALYAKMLGEEVAPFVARLGADGTPTARASLRGPYWRHSGPLRVWGDTLVSLSGFRPVVNLLPLGFEDEARADSMALKGFNSPMLERSYAYAQGDASKPPLLAASATAVGNTLYVLNLRPGWVRIDAYDRQGRLQRRLIEDSRTGSRNFYPVDLAARRTEEGIVFAVAVRSPEARLELYRWSRPDPADTTAAPAQPAP